MAAALTAAGDGRPDFYPHLRELFTLPSEPLALAVTVFGVVIAAPVSEELLFRGLLYTSVRERWGFWPALLLTSTLFAAVHYEPTGVYALLVLPVRVTVGLAPRSDGRRLRLDFDACSLQHGGRRGSSGRARDERG